MSRKIIDDSVIYGNFGERFVSFEGGIGHRLTRNRAKRLEKLIREGWTISGAFDEPKHWSGKPVIGIYLTKRKP